MKRTTRLAVALLPVLVDRSVSAFCPGTSASHADASACDAAEKSRWRTHRKSRLFQQFNSRDDQQGMDGTDSKSSLDPREELSPPVFSLTRKSLLFDEDSSPSSDDQGGNDQVLTSDLGKEAGTLTLALWSGAKSVLPPLLTGASETTSGDKDALGSLYNLLFVRLPTVCVGVGYLVNLMQGHPLMMDPFGTGPFEVSPILVLAALWAILRY